MNDLFILTQKKVGCTKKVFLLIFVVQPFFSCHHQSFFFSILIILSLKFSEKKRSNPEIKLILMFYDGTTFRNFFFKQSFTRLETFFIKKKSKERMKTCFF